MAHRTDTDSQEWLLKRNCSLSPAQLALWFGCLAFLSLGISLVFAAIGAWMVVPFAIIEVTVLGVAFFVFGRHAADYERIVAGPGKILVEQQAPWFRVEYSGKPRDLIQVVGPGQTLPVGRFVPSSIRSRLAMELRRAFAATASTVV